MAKVQWGISALHFDLEQKLTFIKNHPSISYIEYGVDLIEDFHALEKAMAKYEKADFALAFHLPLKANPVEDNPFLRKANLFFVKNILQEGLKYKPLYFNLHLGHLFQWKYEQNTEYYHTLAAEYINELLAVDDRVHLYVENMYSLSSHQKSGDLISFGKSVDEIDSVLSSISSDRLSFCWDVGHGILSKEDYLNSYLSASAKDDYLLHYNTNHGQWDEHLGFQVEGYGKDYLEKLSQSGRFRYILLELPMQELHTIDLTRNRSHLC